MNNTLEGTNSRVNIGYQLQADEWISDLEDRMMEITATKQNIEKITEKKKA